MNAIPQVIKDFLGSEKAVAAGLLVVAATVFVLTGKISFADWQTYTTNLLGIYVAGKTIQGTAAAIISGRTKADPAPVLPPNPDSGVIIAKPETDQGVIISKDGK
jgi:hypothetical protein